MKLTGKALNAFKSWYEVKYGKHYSWSIFIDLPESMQFGVYQDFADSLEHESMILSNGLGKFHYKIYDTSNTFLKVIEEFKTYDTRKEARNAAIEKLNEIINNG